MREVASYYKTEPPRVFRSSLGQPSARLSNQELSLSASHSRDRALLAVSQGRDLGVDLEYMRKDLNFNSIARDHFSLEELQFYSDAANNEQSLIFYHIWTQKEAVSKALGKGLQIDFRSIEVEPDPHRVAKLIRLQDQKPTSSWKLLSSNLNGDYYYSLAVRGEAWDLNWLENVQVKLP
jgi:4'-phosphopantetheinyl transferase